MDMRYEKNGNCVTVSANGTPKEIAGLVAALQDRQGDLEYVLVREPYQTRYSLVKAGPGRESSLDAVSATCVDVYAEEEGSLFMEEDKEVREMLFDLLAKNPANLVQFAVDTGIPIVIDGDRTRPTGKTTLCDYLKKKGAAVCETWELEEGKIQPDGIAGINTVSVTIRLNKELVI